MITDNVLGAIYYFERMLPEHDPIIGLLTDMLRDYDEDEWASMSHVQKMEWMRKYLPQNN